MNYLDKLKHLHQRPDTGSTTQAGDRLEWQRADLSIQHGVVDFVHLDTDGKQWAFVSMGETWAVVNVKYSRKVEASL